MEIKFTVILEPKAQKRARSRAITSNGRSYAMTYKDKDQRLEENKLLTLMLPYRPQVPLQGPLALGVKVFLPIPQSKPKKFQAGALAGAIRPTTKPDLDNLLKHFKDVCTGIFWQDDRQIVEYLPGTGKYYGEPARWEIEIKPLNGPMV